jgi:hypothetical protein
LKKIAKRPPYRTSKLQEKPSALKREHPALQKMKFINCFILFWAIYALLDPYPECESGSPLNPDPDTDPKHYFAGTAY